MITYQPQVGKDHYRGRAYQFQDRWNSYWHQLTFVHTSVPKSVLEVGVGEGVVARELRDRGIAVTTLDIAEDLKPDMIGSITGMPVPDKSFDVVLAAEILEHIRFEDVPQALREIVRVARKGAVISIPHPGYVFSLIFKLPLLPRIEFLRKIPFFWSTHRFNGEHYWELGKRGFSERAFLQMTQAAGLHFVEARSYADDPAHRFFLFEIQK